MKAALKAFLISYGIYFALGGVLIVYLLYSKKLGDMTLIDFLTTFSNCFGVFLIILCLGNGLVYIPKRYFQKTNKQLNFKYYLFQLAETDEDKASLRIELEDLLKLIHLYRSEKTSILNKENYSLES